MPKKQQAQRARITYEPEADVLTWEITNQPIDFAKEIGNIVVHFTKQNIPVLIEILEASSFIKKTKQLIGQEHRVKTPAFAGR